MILLQLRLKLIKWLKIININNNNYIENRECRLFYGGPGGFLGAVDGEVEDEGHDYYEDYLEGGDTGEVEEGV